MHLKEQVMSSLFLSDQELIAEDFSACTSVDPGEQCEARKNPACPHRCRPVRCRFTARTPTLGPRRRTDPAGDIAVTLPWDVVGCTVQEP